MTKIILYHMVNACQAVSTLPSAMKVQLESVLGQERFK